MARDKIRAGHFEADISGPYPCWLTLKYNGEEVLRTVRHDELRDLAYVVEHAMKEARLKLKPTHDDEV